MGHRQGIGGARQRAVRGEPVDRLGLDEARPPGDGGAVAAGAGAGERAEGDMAAEDQGRGHGDVGVERDGGGTRTGAAAGAE